MRFLSVCSGIEAASVAWTPLGWEAVAFSEIEPFPCAVLAHRYPSVPNWGDMTKFQEWPDADVDLLCGGTPCQSFSVAGLRQGLADPRGNLMLTFGSIAAKYRPRWLVWENVPGVLSSNGGRDFGAFLGMLGQLGYGFAYRVLDAQYFGVPQRRRRVFVVGCLGDWRRAAAVLFERHSLSGHPAPSRESGKVAPTIPSRSTGGGGLGTDFDCDGGLIHADQIARCVTAGEAKRQDWETCNFVAYTLKGEGFDASEDGTGRGTPPVPVAFNARQDPDRWHDRTGPLDTDGGTQAVSYAIQAGALRTNPASGPDGVGVQADHAYTLEARAEVQAVAFAQNSRDEVRLEGGDGQRCGALSTGGGKPGQGVPMVATAQVVGAMSAAGATERKHGFGWGQQDWENGYCQPTFTMQVRRLTPTECERLQGFQDDYTRIPWKAGYWSADKHAPEVCAAVAEQCPDGPRYKALGNSWAVPVVRWIGKRIQEAA